MFHLTITLAYIIPNIYLFLRTMNLFITRKYRWLYGVIYLGIALIYPLTQGFAHRHVGALQQFFYAAGNYLIPFYLYLFLGMLLFDLFLLVNTWAKILSPERRKSFRFRAMAFSILCAISLTVVIGGIINLHTIRITHYRLVIPARSGVPGGIRAAFIADFHLNEQSSPRFVKKFVRKINGQHADIILYGGDIIDGSRLSGKMDTIESILRNIHAHLGSYATLGNHEYYSGQENGGFYRKAGITLLRDSVVEIGRSFYLAGRDDEHARHRKSAGELVKGLNPPLPLIVLDHRPTDYENEQKAGIDLVLSGHTHDGQLFPINLITNRVYELSWGYLKKGNTNFIVTSGLQLWGPPVKTAGKAELVIMDIEFRTPK